MERTSDGDHNPGVRGAMLVDINQVDWMPLSDGVKFKLLRYCEVTGDWTLYVQLQPGVKFGRHQHISPAEFFITKGELVFERGSAGPGVFAYEEIGEIHEEAGGDCVTEFLYFGHGPVAFLNPDDSLQFVVDVRFYRDAWSGKPAQELTDPASTHVRVPAEAVPA